MEQFQFIIPNGKSKLYDRFAIFLFILNAVVIAAFFTRSIPNDLQLYIGLAALALSVLAILYYFLHLSFLKKSEVFLLSMLMIAFYWTSIGYWWIGLLMVILIMLYSRSQREMLIRINKEQVTYPSFPQKVIQWDQLNNIVLKDGLLTIDMKNNKIIQHLVNDNGSVNEKAFNEFCQAKLKQS